MEKEKELITGASKGAREVNNGVTSSLSPPSTPSYSRLHGHLLSTYIFINYTFVLFKADITSKGYIGTVEQFFTLLLVACCGYRGITVNGLVRSLYSFQTGTKNYRNTYNRVNRLVKYGYVSKINNRYYLSLHAEKFLFSNIDKDLLKSLHFELKHIIREDNKVKAPKARK